VNTEDVVKHLRVLWRTDRIIADIRMRHLLIGLGLRAFAALIAAFGLLMLELSAYFALVQIWSAISAAAILGAVNFAIAAVLFVIAARPPAGRELELATEIHGSAVDALQLEARVLQSQVSGMIHRPLNGVLPLLIVPLITIIIRSLKKPAAAAPLRQRLQRSRISRRPPLASDDKRGAIPHAKCPFQADPEHIPSCSVSADSYRARTRTWSPRGGR
jgi:membrane protein implicated in regulation of membrane protease activity